MLARILAYIWESNSVLNCISNTVLNCTFSRPLAPKKMKVSGPSKFHPYKIVFTYKETTSSAQAVPKLATLFFNATEGLPIKIVYLLFSGKVNFNKKYSIATKCGTPPDEFCTVPSNVAYSQAPAAEFNLPENADYSVNFL